MHTSDDCAETLTAGPATPVHAHLWQLHFKYILMYGSYSSNHSHVWQLQLKSFPCMAVTAQIIPMYGSYSSNPCPSMAGTAQIHSHALELKSSNPFPCMAVTAQIHSRAWQLQLKIYPHAHMRHRYWCCSLELLNALSNFRYSSSVP